MKFQEAKNKFRKWFISQGDKYPVDTNRSDCFKEEDHYIYAIASDKLPGDLKRGVHYELVGRSNEPNAEYYVEFHFELYNNQLPKLRKMLEQEFSKPENRRRYLAYTRWSSSYWRTRMPIVMNDQNIDGLNEDIAKLFDVVDPVINSFWGAKAQDSSQISECEVQTELHLPTQCGLKEISTMLADGYNVTNDKVGEVSKNVLVLPPVQRGKVWNAARTVALWDSIMRGFPIGALAVRKNSQNHHVLELLDGQQRSTAISLAYASFPPTDSDRLTDSVLWIDLSDKKCSGEIIYPFYVTTASQPWGYADSTSETRNELLRTWERKVALKRINENWHEDRTNYPKPYPCELWPLKAECPVPFTLLRDYVKKNGNSPDQYDINSFLNQYRKENVPPWCNWVTACTDVDRHNSRFKEICDCVSKLGQYSVNLLDASGVAENDIALYFTRIGKGGVVPSDEELAYSVLKAKLDFGKEFRDSIEKIYGTYGLATPSRIAHLVLRYCKSCSDEGSFYSGSALSVAIELCKSDTDSNFKDRVRNFINTDNSDNENSQNNFLNLIVKIDRCVFDSSKTTGLTKWHRTRYCQEFNLNSAVEQWKYAA